MTLSIRSVEIRSMARTDWFILQGTAVIPLLATQLFLLQDQEGLKEILSQARSIIVIGLILFVLAIFVDFSIRALSTRSFDLDQDTVIALLHCSRFPTSDLSISQVQRLRIAPVFSDVTAKVQGVLRPRIVISGGMLASLRRNNIRAWSILAHECSHARHWDRLLFIWVGAFIFSVLYQAIAMSVAVAVVFAESLEISPIKQVINSSIGGVYDLAIFVPLLVIVSALSWALVSSILRYRELYADLAACHDAATTKAYVEMLRSAAARKWMVWRLLYLSNARRANELQTLNTIIKSRIFKTILWFWLFVYAAVGLLAIIYPWFDGQSFTGEDFYFLFFYRQFGIFGVIYCAGCLLIYSRRRRTAQILRTFSQSDDKRSLALNVGTSLVVLRPRILMRQRLPSFFFGFTAVTTILICSITLLPYKYVGHFVNRLNLDEAGQMAKITADQQLLPRPVTGPYTIFFHHATSDISLQAGHVIELACNAASIAFGSRVEVDGYDDTARAASESQALSLSRANAVAAALAKCGVSPQLITVQAFGSSQQWIATADLVREPSNRRAQIIFLAPRQ